MKPVEGGMMANLKPNASAGQLKQDEGGSEQISVVETDLQAAPRNKTGARERVQPLPGPMPGHEKQDSGVPTMGLCDRTKTWIRETE